MMNLRKAGNQLIILTSILLIWPVYFGCPEKADAETRELKLAGLHPGDHPITLTLQSFADRVEKYSDGGLKVRVFPAQQLVKGKEMLDGVGLGTTEMGWIIGVYFAGQLPLHEAPFLPFILSSHESAIRAYREGGIGKILEPNMEKYGVKPLFWGTSGWCIPMFDKPVKTADWSGLKLRGFGKLIPRFYQLAGAGAVSISSPEIYIAAQRGLVNGCITTYANIMTMRLHEVLPFVWVLDKELGTGVVEGVNSVSINTKVWKSLNGEQQASLMKAAEETEQEMIKTMEEFDSDAFTDIKEAGCTPWEVPKDVKDEMVRISQPLWDEWTEKNAPHGKEILEILLKYNQ
jgi:C4-dicarboxylate-binding protein DctP